MSTCPFPKRSPEDALGYLGVDVVIDEDLGPLVLEVNAKPGLQVQNVTGVGLATRLKEVDGYHQNGSA